MKSCTSVASLQILSTGLSDEDIIKDRTEHAAFWEKISQRPKQKIKYSFSEKQQFDYVREVTSKNVWWVSHSLTKTISSFNTSKLSAALISPLYI